MKKLDYLIKHNKIIQNIYVFTFSFIFKVLGLFFKVDSKQIMFQSLIGRTYGDSPKVIYDELKRNEKFKDYHFVWAFKNPEKFKNLDCKIVKLDSLSYFIQLFKSKYWISNVGIERGLKFKKKSQIYINTWHGIPIKKIGNSQSNRSDYDYSDVDLMLSSCEYEKKIFINDFNVKPQNIILSGMPRNDRLYSAKTENVEMLKDKLGLPQNKKIILYAPTWRESVDGGKEYKIAPPIDIEKWKKRLGNDYILLFRMHHLVTKQLDIKFDDFVHDFSEYNDVNDLMIISDILISDYSALIFDYSILEKPIISFAFDYDDYKKRRGVYIELNDILPGSIVEIEDDLLDFILSEKIEVAKNNAIKIKKEFMPLNGISTAMCLNYIQERDK